MAVIGFCEGCRRNAYVGDLEERACPACGRTLAATRLDEDRARAIGANQSRFRAANEEVTEDTSPSGEVHIVCECAAIDCEHELDIPAETYSHVRSHAARFIVTAGHHIPEVERIVDSAADYHVVEKLGEARGEALARAESG